MELPDCINCTSMDILIFLVAPTLATLPSADLCKRAWGVIGLAGAACNLVGSAAFMLNLSVCVGSAVSVSTFGTFCYAAGHLQPLDLPPIAHMLSNGTIIDRPGNTVFHINSGKPFHSRHATIKRDRIPNRDNHITLPDIDFTLDDSFYQSVGDAADKTPHCTGNTQRCISDTNAILTCVHGAWRILQACGRGSKCSSHAHNLTSRVMCEPK